MTDQESVLESLTSRFRQLYGSSPQVFRAPGRVNLIGEHTDYNDGFVMPAAIDLYTWVAVGGRSDPDLHVYSQEFDEKLELSLDSLDGKPRKHWSDYVRGVAALLQAAGHLHAGADMAIHGEVPLGAGLSSSAALEVSTALALLSLSNLKVPPLELVKMCQRAEHEYAGTRCGIMDQFIATFGKDGHALMLDCRSLDYKALPVPGDVRLVICNSMVRHELAAGEYNQRRADCEAAVKIMQQNMKSVRALRDVTLADLDKQKGGFPDIVYRRARHVISENQRVLDAAEGLEGGELSRFGELMYESHRSLRDDYEVSCEELDLLVELASRCEGVYGARMTGGGFGGCTINLVRTEAVDGCRSRIAEEYKKVTGKTLPIYVCTAAQGAGAC